MGKQLASLDRALAAVRARADEMISLTRAWVEVNSYTANVDGVNQVGAMLREAFALPSLALTTIAADGFGDHLVWRTPAATSGAILLVGHHDTVFPPGHFEGWREDGRRAIGPGALDMKGGLAVVRTALAALDEVGALASLPIIAISVSDEEVGSPTSAAHLRELAHGAACALVFESGRANDMIITRRKGVGAMIVTAHGKAAHAGNNHKDGANAIWALARFVDAAQQLTDYGRGVTVNVGQLTGGTSKNTVPERAECMLDLRYETVADAERLVAALRTAADLAAAAIPGVRLEVSGGANRLPLERTPASAALRRLRARLGPRPRRGSAPRRRLRRQHRRAARRPRDRRPRSTRRRVPHEHRVRRARHVRAEGRGARAVLARARRLARPLRAQHLDVAIDRRVRGGDALLVGVDELEHPLDDEPREAVDHRPRHAERIREQRIVDRHDPAHPGVEVFARQRRVGRPSVVRGHA